MKKLIAVAAITMLPLISFAQPISLKAGSSVVIAGDLVTCEAPSEQNSGPACSIRQSNGLFYVYIGQNIATTEYSFNGAVNSVKELKNAGLCQ